MRRFSLLLLTTIIAIFTFSNHTSIHAESVKEYNTKIQDLEKKQQNLKSKQKKVSDTKKSVQNKMSDNLNEQKSVETQLNEIEEKLKQTKAEITEKETEIDQTNKEISELETEIKQLKEEIIELEERIKRREELLKDRLRSIQEAGGKIQYMSVILGSQSFNDLITRSSAVNSIMDQDKLIMDEHTADQLALEQKQTEVEEKKKSVESKKKEQESQKAKLEGLQSQLDEQVAEKERLKKELEKEYEELEEVELTLEEEQQLINSQAAVIEKAKQLAEEEKNKLQQQQQQQTTGNTTGNAQSTVKSSSGFIWPTSGKVTSGYGPRVHPITGQAGKMHNGLDIAAPPGTTVVSAASGVVAYAGWMNGYGNTIMVSHGSTTTLYAHLSSISVSRGQRVGQGQTIGTVGSTGNSTGPHLHFEVHPGGYKNPANPRGYLP